MTVKPPPRSLLTPLEIEFAHMYNVSALHVHVCVRVPLCLIPRVVRAHTSPPCVSLERELLYARVTGGDAGWQSCGDLPRVIQQGRVGAEAQPSPVGLTVPSGKRESSSAEKRTCPGLTDPLHPASWGFPSGLRAASATKPWDQPRAGAAPVTQPRQGSAGPGCGKSLACLSRCEALGLCSTSLCLGFPPLQLGTLPLPHRSPRDGGVC